MHELKRKGIQVYLNLPPTKRPRPNSLAQAGRRTPWFYMGLGRRLKRGKTGLGALVLASKAMIALRVLLGRSPVGKEVNKMV